MRIRTATLLAFAIALPCDADSFVAVAPRIAPGGWVAAVLSGSDRLLVQRDGEPPAVVARASEGVSWPAVTALPGGDVALAWVEGDSSSSRLLVTRVHARGADAPVRVSSPSARYARFPSIAAAPEGELWVAWVDGSMEDDRIVVSRSVGAGFSSPEQVSLPDASEDLVPQVGFDARGVPVVVWAGLDGHDDEILWSRRGNDGWSPEARIHPDNPFPDITPWMARDGNGRLHVAWSGYDGESYQVLWSALEGERWTAPVRLSSGAGAATLPRVLPASGKRALVAWNQYDGRGTSIPAASLVGDGPPIAVAAPRGVTIGLSSRPAVVLMGRGLVLLEPSGERLVETPLVKATR